MRAEIKKWIKVGLIIRLSLIAVWWAWAWLTKAWVIPNWFDIETLNWKSLNNCITQLYDENWEPLNDCSFDYSFYDTPCNCEEDLSYLLISP